MSESLAARLNPAARPFDLKAAKARLADGLKKAPALKAAMKDHPAAEALLRVLADGSPYLWQLVVQAPERAAALLSAAPEESRARILREVRQAGSDPALTDAELMKRLRQAKQEMALLLAMSDIGGVWGVPEVTRALSDLADGALSAALRFLLRGEAARDKWRPADPQDPEQGCGLIVLAMGKHGARELNYSSDIDLIIFYDPEVTPLGEGVEPQPFFVRLVQRLVKIMQERTGDGYVFRTDLRLRPDPASTPVAISRLAALNYYESVGQNWERAAMLKARPCAGDLEAGEALLKELRPFVWRKFLDYAAIADIHAMKRQIHVHRGHGQIAVEGHNVKLGRGGIREIEFFVQTQQLVAGGRNMALRVRSTEEALAALTAEGWIDEKTRGELVHAYRFLRTIEHRLQMVADEQTHSLPEEEEALDRFAAFAGYKSRAAFAKAFTEQLEIVQGHYAHLFEDAPPLAVQAGSLVFTGDEDDPETLDTLRRMGFDDPAPVSALVRGWHHGRVAATRSARARELLTELIPALLDAVARTADPWAALRALDRVLARLSAGTEFFALLRSNPGFLGLLADALGTAPRLGEMVAKRPHVLDAMMEPAFFASLPSGQLVAERLERALDEAVDYEDLLNRARIFGQEQLVLIGMRVLSGSIDAQRAGVAFARLADMLVARLQTAVEQELAQAHGRVKGGHAAVLAMGKLGGREMTAASDLDLILVFDHPADIDTTEGRRPLAPTQFYARLTQRLVAAISAPTAEGRLYDVDLRLRPSGRSGPVATKLSGFLSYQTEEAWTWEHMALTRARSISGDAGFRKEVEATIAAILQSPRSRAKVAKDVLEMRATLGKEKGEGDPWDLKYAKGGLIDLEFTAQFLQLVHAHEHPRILDTNTARVFDHARDLGIITVDAWETLARATRLQHDLTQILRLCLEKPFVPAEAGPGIKQLLARAGGAPDFAALDAELRELQSEVRRLFREIVRG